MTSPHITSVSVKNFKCFENLKAQFGKLTVLAGYNGTGKSTIIHPILLLSQVINEFRSISTEQGKFWPLNGNLIRLGTAGDVLFDDYEKPEIEFYFEFSDNRQLQCNLVAEKGKRYLFCKRPDVNMMSGLEFISNLSYISAIRGSADEIYPSPDHSENIWTGVGINGQYACYLYNIKANESDRFRMDVNEWLDYIAPSANANAQLLINTSHLTLNFRLSDTSEPRKPANIGYGLSYTFPIIVSLLAANEGDLIIIDSPEAHLHPHAQSRMGIMLAEFAAKGIQIIVETHSDHVLAGIRFAVKDKKLKQKDLSILFSSVSKEKYHEVCSPNISEFETYSNWSEKFMNNPYGKLWEL